MRTRALRASTALALATRALAVRTLSVLALAALALAALALAALALAAAPRTAVAQQDTASAHSVRPRTTYEDLQMLSGVLNQIRVNHPDSVNTHTLLMAAIQGLVRAADPHSYVIERLRLDPAREKAYAAGKLVPVPVTFDYVDETPVVTSVPPGTAAARADILPGDVLLAADGNPINAESATELEIALSGARNSAVRLTVERRRMDGSAVQLERVVRREKVGEATSVPAAFLLDSTTGYVRITTFANDRAADDLRAALGRLEQQGMQRLVLDLRDNGGGSVREAATVAGAFLPTGAIVYTSSGRKADVADTGRVKRAFWNPGQRRYPIALLINSGTASASELVAGALQDHDRALIVGRPSFGKSLLMQGFPLPDGSVFVMVIGQVRTPCGRVIQREYRGVARRDYYRLARAERDTAGRPSCRTSRGRTVYGGGGIYPDVLLPEPAPEPLWLSRVRENALLLRWAGGYMDANAGAFPSLDAFAANPSLPADALASFRRLAAAERDPVPEGADADRVLTRAIVEWIAGTKWGEEGYYRLAAVGDPEIRAAVAAFGQASSLLAGSAGPGN